jgi:GntR family transcriptional repressor for pyruvate dehydrogenase complex
MEGTSVLAPKVKAGSLVEGIFEEIRRQIITGELKPGSRLTAERELAVRYKTNRNTLREAIRKLEHARLVTVRHGQGVTVADFRQTGTIELIGPFLAASTDEKESARCLLDLLAARETILELAVQLAAARADASDTARLQRAGDEQIAAFERRDQAALVKGELEFVDGLVAASHSLAVRWIANTLLEIYRSLTESITELWVMEPEFPTYLRTLLGAIARHDAKTAAMAARDYYRRVDAQLLSMLGIQREAG